MVAARNPSRVLLVEKERIIRQLLTEVLRAEHREVFPVGTAAEALQVAKDESPLDVALIERTLPDGSGLDLTADLKRLDPTTEVIIMSAAPSLEAVLHAVEAGASDFLPKPFTDIRQVAWRIENAEEQARLRRERQRLHQALVESEERYRKLFESTPDAIIVCDEQSGRIEDCNLAALALYGYAKDSLLGLPGSALWANEDERDPVPSDTSGVHRRRDRTRDGKPLEVEVVTGRFQLGGRHRVVEIVRDISDRLRAEQARSQLEEQLRQSQKTEALGRLAGGVAHDFNNLLAVILNYANFVAQGLREPRTPAVEAALREDIEQVLQAAISATAVTRQLLAFSRREVLRPRVIGVNEVVRAVERLLRRTMGPNLELCVELCSNPCPVCMDPGQLEQVLVNLAVNAQDAMPRGGKLSVRTALLGVSGEREPGGPITPLEGSSAAESPPALGAGWVEIVVGDTGTGIDPGIVNLIFEPFFTTKERDKGTGLGLATVKGIVDGAGGDIEVQTALGHGTTVTIRLPLTADALEPPPAAIEQPWRPPQGETILVVDDESPVRRALCRMLRRAGYQVLSAATGAEALAMAEEHPEPVDLLLTDVMMPGMSGEELVARLQERQPGLRSIYITGYATSSVIGNQGPGVDQAVLPKPFTEQRLLGFVREVLDVKR